MSADRLDEVVRFLKPLTDSLDLPDTEVRVWVLGLFCVLVTTAMALA